MSIAFPGSKCSQCDYTIHSVTHLSDDEAVPQPGGLLICLRCAHVAKYGDGLVVELTQGELVDLPLDSEFVEYHKRLQWAIRQVWAQERGKAL